MSKLTLLFVSTSVGAIGSGLGGGVELTLYNVAREMLQRGHDVRVLAPRGSFLLDVPILEVPGSLQRPAQRQERQTPIQMPPDPVLGNFWMRAYELQTTCDLIVNFAYDWLPFYLTPFFQTPIAHFVSMGSLSDAMDDIVAKTAAQFPNTIGVYTRSQAATFPGGDRFRILDSGIDLSIYQFCAHPKPELAWVARISPEKALEDAVAAAHEAGMPLKVMGKLQDMTYWQQVLSDHPNAQVEYAGFLSTEGLQQELRTCQALLMTPRWVEAFGNVAIEALACGVPVIAYRRGGPTEIIREGETGFLVEPDSVQDLVAAIARVKHLDRRACRQQAEEDYSLTALGDRFEQWFQDILRDR